MTRKKTCKKGGNNKCDEKQMLKPASDRVVPAPSHMENSTFRGKNMRQELELISAKEAIAV